MTTMRSIAAIAVTLGLVTPAGKALLPGRIAEENAFLDALARETQNFDEF